MISESLDKERINQNLHFHRIILVGMLFAFLPAWLAGCSIFKNLPVFTSKQTLIKIPPGAYPRFADDMHYDGMEHCVVQSLNYLKQIPPSRNFTFGGDVFDAAHMVRSMEQVLSFIRARPTSEDMKKFIETHYWVYRSVGTENPGQVLYTGYYEPILRGIPNRPMNMHTRFMPARMISFQSIFPCFLRDLKMKKLSVDVRITRWFLL